MPKKQYRHTEYAKAAKRRARAKLIRVGFELNMPQTAMAKNFDPTAHGATSLHTLAKKLLLAYMEEHSPVEDNQDNNDNETGE